MITATMSEVWSPIFLLLFWEESVLITGQWTSALELEQLPEAEESVSHCGYTSRAHIHGQQSCSVAALVLFNLRTEPF